MIDVYAASGTFADTGRLAKDLANAMMRWEKVPPIALFADNTAAFVHELASDAIADANGNGNHVRVQILTPIGVLDREKMLGCVAEMTEIVVAAAADSTLRDRTWILITESPDGGWGIGGHAFTRAEIADAARKALSKS
jgi:phenylpyruvate tautomerase PptA (4-oxalocrotonate tautomerase family)